MGDLNKNEVLTVVLSRNYSTGLSVIRSLGTQGYTVDLAASAPREGASSFIAKSKFVRSAHEAVAKKVKDEDDQELMDMLTAYREDQTPKKVLIPADDYTASVMDFHKEELKDIFLMPGIITGEPGSLAHMMDKSVQGQIARRVGIRTPLEWVVSLREEEIRIPEDMVYPCYVKPLGSIGGYKQEMARCDDKEALLEHLLKLREAFSNRSVLVQEFVNIDKEYDIEGVCIDDKIILSGVIYKEYVAQYDRGVPLYGDMEPLDILGGFIDKIEAFLREFHYFGMFDLGINKVGDEFWFNELNLRSGGTNYVYFESGCNLSEIFVKAALGEEITEEECRIREFGKKYLYEKVAWDDYFHKTLTRDELQSMIDNADIHIMVNDYDPVPGDLFNEEVHEEERKIKNREIREKHIASVMEKSGWDRDTVRENIKNARANFKVSYKEYDQFDLWKFEPEEQEDAYNKAVAKKERIARQREECIEQAMDLAGWEREYAIEQINEARKRLGVSYNIYRKNNFCLMTPEEQDEEYEKIKMRKAEEQ